MSISISEIREKLGVQSKLAQTQLTSPPQKESVMFVNKTTKLTGVIVAPPSKSYTLRAIIIGSMNGTSQIINPLSSGDTDATISAWGKLGASISRIDSGDKPTLIIKGFEGKPKLQANQIDVGEAGTLLRFILPILGLANEDVTLIGNGTLRGRPNDMIVEPLRKLGVDIEAQGAGECLLPITVHGKGRMGGGEIPVRGDMSSQVVSALLIVAPFAENDVLIHINGQLVSRPYVDITIDVLKQAGIEVVKKGQDFQVKKGQEYGSLKNYVIHGDYSSAAFLMAAACLVDSDITIQDLVKDKQGDREIVSILRRMGANINHVANSVTVRGSSNLRAIEICGTDIPDLIPAIAAVAVFAEGRSRIYGIRHLRYKESNRITSLANELKKLNVDITATDDELTINGPSSICTESPVSSYSDHRIAMALAIIGLRTGGLSITQAQCISKSYPNFISDMKHIGAVIDKR